MCSLFTAASATARGAPRVLPRDQRPLLDHIGCERFVGDAVVRSQLFQLILKTERDGVGPLCRLLFRPGEASDILVFDKRSAVTQGNAPQAGRSVTHRRHDPAGFVEFRRHCTEVVTAEVEHHTMAAGEVDGVVFLDVDVCNLLRVTEKIHELAVAVAHVGAEVTEHVVSEALRVDRYVTACRTDNVDFVAVIGDVVVEVRQFAQLQTCPVADLLVLGDVRHDDEDVVLGGHCGLLIGCEVSAASGSGLTRTRYHGASSLRERVAAFNCTLPRVRRMNLCSYANQ